MEETRLRLDPNEASDLTPVFDADTLARNGWDKALATVLDESPAEEAIALLVHRAGAPAASGWDAHRIECKPPRGVAGRTSDAESCACRDGWLYLLGSQYGGKGGPLEPRRSWIARTRVDALAARLDGGHRPRLQVARLRFALHRAVNEALLRASAVELMPLSDRARAAFIDTTIAAGARGGKRWAGRVKPADHPVNVEGAAFRANGRLLLGLRYPVTRDGHALLVELDSVDMMFGEAELELACRNVWTLVGAGSAERPAGVRALHSDAPDSFHAVLGNLDALGKGSVLIDGLPEGGEAESAHVRFRLPAAAAGGDVAVGVVHEFHGIQRIEGIALVGSEAHYVIDEDGAVGMRTLVLEDG